MRTEQIAAVVTDSRATPRVGGWTSYCQLVALLSAGQSHSREKEDKTDNASTH